MDERNATRRRFLTVSAGVTLSLGLAGCGAPTQSGQDGTPGGESHEDDHGPAGHAEESHGHGTIEPPSDLAEVAVNTTDEGQAHFRPHVTRVTVGGTVRWVLESGSHTATAYHPGNDQPRLVPEGTAAWDSGYLSEEGETFEHTFETEGVYHYFCIPHETQGMIGTVIVGEPDANDQAALQEPPADKTEDVRAKLTELNEMVESTLEDDHGDDDHQDEEDGHHEETETEDHHEEDSNHDEATTTDHHE